MTYFVGIDGGQSSTVAVVGDERGRVLGRASAGPADEVAQGVDSTRLRDALHAACAGALRSAGALADVRCAAIVAGISGFDGVRGVSPELPSDRVVLMHDAPIAHAGAFGGAPGVVVIAGTGSVAYRIRVDGGAETFGGWGYLFGDEGSAFWIARNAIAHATTFADCACTASILGHFERDSLRALVRDIYRDAISRDRVASFASVCIGLARAGDPCASSMIAEAAAALARLAEAPLEDHAEALPVAYVGGMMSDPWFKALVYSRVNVAHSGATIVEPRYDPAYGALLLAYKEAGVAVSDLEL